MKWTAVSIITLLLVSQASFAAKKHTLVAVKSTSTPVIDGQNEQSWQQAEPIKVLLDEQPYEPNNGYNGALKTTVAIQAMYDAEYLYMKFVWKDDHVSLARFPWEKQADGSWKHLKNLDSTLHENTYYEDKLAVYWNISEKGFKKKGCDKSCHLIEDNGLLEGVKDTSSGRHYTKAGYLDEWHWKATRTDVNYQMDDGYLDSEHETNKKWGRHTDEKTGGGYYNNVNKDNKSQPAWMSVKTRDAAGTDPIYYLVHDEKIDFEDTFSAGDRLPGIVTAPFEGSRGDVIAKGHWIDNEWTLEVKRKLITEDSPERDIQFNNTEKPYFFGVTTFDNSQIAHLHHTGSLKLIFQK